jgi:small redox-active disulfide protein 2
MDIKVLGSGCATCHKLHELVKQAVAELGADADVAYITDIAEIMKSGVMHMPGLIINGKVKAMGRMPSVRELKLMISDEM